MPPAPARLRVAICGGGIGGLNLALALAPYEDITVDIYEAATRFEEIGAGFVIWGRSVAALKKLGLEEKLRTIAPGKNEPASFELRKAELPSRGELVGHLVLSTNFGFHRAQFIELLAETLSNIGRVTTHFGKRCISFNQRFENHTGDFVAEDLVTLHFLDGTSATCDVLIGCDGIKSAVRGQLMRAAGVEKGAKDSQEGLTRFLGTRFSGTVAYRALVKPDDLRGIAGEHSALTVRKMYCGKDKHIVTYPVAGGRFINLIAYSSEPARQVNWESGPWVVEVEHDEVLQQYRDFEPEVQALLKCINKSSRWAMYDIEPLNFWSTGRVTLLGDAAHAMTPFIGSGGGQAIEDVYVLSRLLGSSITTRGTLPSVLLAYDQVRRPRANIVIRTTREARRVLEYQEEYGSASGSDVEQAMRRLTGWLWEGEGEPDDDVCEAKRLVQQLVASTSEAQIA